MLDVIHLSGSPHEMGRQHGRQLRDEIHALARDRLGIARKFAAEHGVEVSEGHCRAQAAAYLPHHEAYSPAVMAEWRGIAEGAGLPLEDVFFANALTDFQDALWQMGGGCTSFAVAPEASADGAACIGQTWDMHASAEDFIHVFHRRPDAGPESLTMTTSGCLTLVGVNSAGVAAGNNNLRPTDARHGVIYLAMLHEALRQTEWDAARRAITTAHRGSGHNYIMAHESGARANIETTAELYDEVLIDVPRYVHTNHYLAAALREREEPGLDRSSSEHRHARLVELMASQKESLSPEGLRVLLSDHEGGERLCICRHGYEGGELQLARSCAFVVADPRQRALWISVGPPCEGTLRRYALQGADVEVA